MSSHSLSNYLTFLSLSPGLLPTLTRISTSQDARILILDNSHSMRRSDATLMRSGTNFTRIDRIDGVSRWMELSQCVEFHTKMGVRCGLPTQFRLVNDEDDVPKKFSVCWNHGLSSEEMNDEKDAVLRYIKSVRLEHKVNPLARAIRRVQRYLEGEAENLRRNDKFVSVIVCTHGIPTDEAGCTGRAVTKDFIDSLVSLSELPVKIIFRLCTDNDKVVDFFTSLDTKIECDVLDDFWGEAMEVYLFNPWLTYGIGLHRMREAGLGTELMDELDEKAFSLDEIRDFCLEFFIGTDNHLSLRNPNIDFMGFIEDLQNLVSKKKLVWNPLKSKLTPWINVDKLKNMFEHKHQRRHGERHNKLRHTFKSHEDPGGSTFRKKRVDPRANPFSASMNQAGLNKDSADFIKSTFHSNLKSSKRNNSTTHHNPHPKDLNEAIQQWSHEAPTYNKMKPLQTLLVDVSNLFPPTNPYVETHEYFFRWKEFSKDAFEFESGDDLKELLRRALRKAKFFLHPDKWPGDLTESQVVLFKAVWNVVQEVEVATLQ